MKNKTETTMFDNLNWYESLTTLTNKLRYYPEQQQKITQLALRQAYDMFYRCLGFGCYFGVIPIGSEHKKVGSQLWELDFIKQGGSLSDTRTYDEIEMLYLQLNADQLGSTLMADLAFSLFSRASLFDDNDQYEQALRDCDRAKKLYLQLNADQPGSPLMTHLATLLSMSGRIFQLADQYELAMRDYKLAEELHLQVTIDQPSTNAMNHLAQLLCNMGALFHKTDQLDLAKQYYDRTEKMYRPANGRKCSVPTNMSSLVIVLSNRGNLNFFLGQYTEAKNDWLDALTLLERGMCGGGTFVDLLVTLSRNLLSLPNSDPNVYLPRIVQLICRHQDRTVGNKDEQFEGADWWPWLHHVLHKENLPLLLTVLAASFARCLQSVLSLNLDESLGGDTDLAEWRQLRKRGHLLRLDLGRMEPDSAAYAQCLTDYQALSRTLDALRTQLLHVYDVEGVALFSTAALQKHLAEDEALVLALSLADFGVEGQETHWLIVTAQRIVPVFTPSLDDVAAQLTTLDQAQRQQAVAYGRRSRQRLAPNQDAAVQTEALNGAAISFDGLKHILQEHWQAVQIQLDSLGIRRGYVVGHGRLCGLPWQGVVPPELDVRQYPGLFALRQTRTPPYPSAATPLVLMGYDAAKEPIRRLYYLPLEMQLITAIWGAEAVRVIETLSQAPEHSLLLLLGHGDFYDNCAYFCGADGDIAQIELALHSHKLSMLGASACLLGSAAKINEEPLGFLSLAACRGDVQFSFGAMMLIDDLLATCLSLLFHWQWRASRDPALAMRAALRQLQTGQWPAPAQQLFREQLSTYLPAMLQAMREDERQEDLALAKRIKLRNSHILHDWTRYIDNLDQALDVVSGNCPGNTAEAVDTLVTELLNALCSNKAHFKDSIEQFVRCWIWG